MREEFRERWSDYYSTQRAGGEPQMLAALKDGILADQRGELESRRDLACAALRASRDESYRTLLNDQRDARGELRWRQELGLDNAEFLSGLGNKHPARVSENAFREAASELANRGEGGQSEPCDRESFLRNDEDEPRMMGGRERDLGDRMSSGVVAFGGSLLDALFLDLVNLGSTPASQPPPRREPGGRDTFDIAAEESQAQQQRRALEEEDADRQRRQRSRYGD